MYEDEQPMDNIYRDSYQPVKPFSLLWGNTEITITEIGYVRKLQEGKTTRHVFSCTDGVVFITLYLRERDVKILSEQLLHPAS